MSAISNSFIQPPHVWSIEEEMKCINFTSTISDNHFIYLFFKKKIGLKVRGFLDALLKLH